MDIISFSTHDVSFTLKDKLLLRSFLPTIFIQENIDFASVSYVFCSDGYLLTLNKRYLDHDTYTDILTFTFSEANLPIISEIYISIDRVKENSKNLKVQFKEELHRVMIHGILHLCGYSDHTAGLKQEMRKKEDFYLSQLTQ
ncbi:MAG: rRNA maturation RNase YbeY [Ginsengibacter sp.]